MALLPLAAGLSSQGRKQLENAGHFAP